MTDLRHLSPDQLSAGTHAAEAEQRNRLAGAAGKLAEALRDLVVMNDPNASRWCDYWGMRFYRETGIWPRFKSAPMAMNPEVDEDGSRFEAWIREKREALDEAARRALVEAGVEVEP